MIKRLIKKLTISAVIIILSAAALSASADAIETWHFEQVATGKNYPQGLGYAADGRPGFVQMDYDSNRAIYRYKSESGSWVSEIIANDVTDPPVLAFSNSGQPSVLYIRYEDSTYKLIYAKRSAEKWDETTIESISSGQGYIDSAYSLAFNSSGNPCVIYIKNTSYPYSTCLYYASYNGATWQKQSVYCGNDLFHSDLTFNGTTPAIAFAAGKGGLKYAYLSSGTWNIQTVDDSSTDGLRNRQSYVTLCFGNGKPLICYNDLATRSLKFAHSQGGNWITTTVEASTGSNNYTGDYATMQVSQGASGYVIYLIHSNHVPYQNSSIKLKKLEVKSDSDLQNLKFVSQTLFTGQYRNNPILVSGIKDGNPGIIFFDLWRSKTTYISMQPNIQTVSSVSFEAASSGSFLSRDITITNNGSLNLSIIETTAPSAPFRITRGDSGSLAPGQSRVITVYFEPTQAGVSYSGTLSIKSNDPDYPEFNISLSGRSIGENANLTDLSFSNGSSLTLNPEETECSLTVAHATKSIKITPIAAHAHAQIKINDNMVQSGEPSVDIPLNIGSNEVKISATSEDGKTNKTYTLNITRRDSPDASLSGLAVSDGELFPAFSPEITEYSMTLPDGVSFFTLTPTARPEEALIDSTISIGETQLTNDKPHELTAAVGKTSYTIHVKAPDKISTKDYVVNVMRLPELDRISLDHGVLDTAFNSYTLSYTVTVPNSATSITVTPISREECDAAVNGISADKVEVELETGENTITVRAVSSNGETEGDKTERIYTLTVIRLPGLAALSVGDTPAMLWDGEFKHTIEITEAECPIFLWAPEGMSVNITGPTSDIISVSEEGISEPISFVEGLNEPYTIELSSLECDETTVYTLTVIRRPLLTSLEIAGNAVEFRPRGLYVGAVPRTCDSVEIRATANAGSTVFVDERTNHPVTGDDGNWTVANLRVGATPVYLVVKSNDEEATTTYTIIIQRLPGLSGLSVSEGSLSPAFSVDTYDYTVNVGRGTSSITLSAAVPVYESGLPEGKLFINGTETSSGISSGGIELSYGNNIIPTVVVADEYYGVKAVYNVNVIREEPETGIVSINSASFDKYASAAGHQDIRVSVTSIENPLLALKNGGSTLVEETDYTVSGNTYTIKKEYLSTLPAGYTSITFDFTYGADPILAVTISDSNPANIGGTSTPQPYNADVSDGRSVPMTVNTGTGSASIILDSLSERLADGEKIVVTVPPISGISNYTANLPSTSISGSRAGSVTVNTGVGNVTIPSNILSGTGLTGSAGITISSVDTSNLPENVQTAIGQRPLISLALTIDGKPVDWSNPDAPVMVSIPYTPTAEELRNPESIVIWYIDGSGNVVTMPNGRYDAASKTVTFSTTHFSDYAVAYNPLSFNDVAADAWYNKAVSFLAAREITNGTGDDNFSPDAKLTRGEFIVMLMRAYGITPDLSSGENFADAGNTYYTGYLAAAKRLGLSNGVGNNRYSPELEITRQEMFALLYNILRSTNQLPQSESSKTISDFTDAGQIDVWARDALTLLVETGVVRGSNGALSPLNTTTRAEMAQVLYNALGK